MNISYLKKEMLIQELVVRGVPVDDSKTVDTLRSTLRPVLKLERLGNFNYPPYSLSFEDEKIQIREFLDAAKEAIRTLSGESAQNKFLSSQSRLVHLLHRTTRIPVSLLTPDQQHQRADLLVEVLASLDSLEIACREDPELSRHFQEPDVEPPVQSSPQFNSTTRQTPQPVVHPSTAKPCNIEKWNVKFSGDSKKFSVHSFLERNNELR